MLKTQEARVPKSKLESEKTKSSKLDSQELKSITLESMNKSVMKSKLQGEDSQTRSKSLNAVFISTKRSTSTSSKSRSKKSVSETLMADFKTTDEPFRKEHFESKNQIKSSLNPISNSNSSDTQLVHQESKSKSLKRKPEIQDSITDSPKEETAIQDSKFNPIDGTTFNTIENNPESLDIKSFEDMSDITDTNDTTYVEKDLNSAYIEEKLEIQNSTQLMSEMPVSESQVPEGQSGILDCVLDSVMARRHLEIVKRCMAFRLYNDPSEEVRSYRILIRQNI